MHNITLATVSEIDRTRSPIGSAVELTNKTWTRELFKEIITGDDSDPYINRARAVLSAVGINYKTLVVRKAYASDIIPWINAPDFEFLGCYGAILARFDIVSKPWSSKYKEWLNSIKNEKVRSAINSIL